jgi:hypothetical protein
MFPASSWVIKWLFHRIQERVIAATFVGIP